MPTVAGLLASIALAAPVPAGVPIQDAPCPGAAESVACVVGGTIYFPLRAYSGDEPRYARLVLAHELGHVWDSQHMTPHRRAAFSRLVGQAGASWYFATTEQWLSLPYLAAPPPGELFADAFAICTFGRYKRGFLAGNAYYGTYTSPISREALAVACWAMRHP